MVRRVALLLIFALCLAAGCGGQKREPTLYERWGGGAAGGRAFVEYVDGLLDQMPEKKMVVSAATIQAWELEILPYFAYEGLVSYPTVPDSITLKPTLDPMEFNHVLGRAYCLQVPGLELPKLVELNFRTANPVSAWYGDSERFVPTLTHELIHIQGVCGDGEASETSTQVVMLETLAAMANHGNELVVYPLLKELRSIGLATLYFRALDNGTPEALADYEKFRDRILGDPFDIARSEKSQRFWFQDANHKAQFVYILRAYNAKVYDKLVGAFLTGWAPDLSIPQAETDRHYNPASYDGTRDFRMDDLIWFLRHAPELVR